MILKDLLLKYEFDALVPDLIAIDEQVKNNLFGFKEAFDTLRRMTPEGDGREQIIVSERVETDEDGLETERYLHASNCEGEIWSSCLAKEVVLEADVTELCALARILWHITFWGFTPEGEAFNDYEKSPMNEYERKAFTLRYHQFCNYARVKRKKNPTISDRALSFEGWKIYNRRKAHRNRAKRMRDARQDRQIEKYTRRGKIQRLIESITLTGLDTTESSYAYLFDTKEIFETGFYSRTTDKGSRAQYIADNITKYFVNDISDYTRVGIVISFSEGSECGSEEIRTIYDAIRPRLVFDKSDGSVYLHRYVDQKLGEDIHVMLICSR